MSYYQMSIPWFSQNTDSMLSFSRICWTDRQDLSVSVFSNKSNEWSSDISRFLKIFDWNNSVFFLNSLDSFGASKVWNNLVLGPMVTSTRPDNMKMRGFRISSWWIPEVICPKWSRVILRSFWANLLIKFSVEMTPQTPPDPKSEFLPGFPLVCALNPNSFQGFHRSLKS